MYPKSVHIDKVGQGNFTYMYRMLKELYLQIYLMFSDILQFWLYVFDRNQYFQKYEQYTILEDKTIKLDPIDITYLWIQILFLPQSANPEN